MSARRLSRTQILNDVEGVLARDEQASTAPKVIWANPGETPRAFAMRCASWQNRGVHQLLAAVPHPFAVPAGVKAVEFAPEHFRLLHPKSRKDPAVKIRNRVAPHGRAAGCSNAFADAVILRMVDRKTRVLAVREFMRSLRDSVHQILSDKIAAHGLDAYFTITDRSIVCKLNDSEVIFGGLATNVRQLKSLEAIDIAYIEEGESVSKESLEVLVPTIRAPGSELWMSLNPDDPAAPIMNYVNSERDDTLVIHTTWRDNPWFPEVLAAERDYLARVDPDAYAHIWEGKCRAHSQAAVFAGKYTIEEFEPDLDAYENDVVLGQHAIDTLWRLGRLRNSDIPRKLWNGPYLGADWGFSQDPTTLVKCWISRKVLYIEYEAYGIGIDIDRTPALFDSVPNASKHVIRADNARPETISYMQRHGYDKMQPVSKGKGSVEDGVAHIRSYERIVIHPRCRHTIEEFRLFSYRVDRLSGDVLTELAPGHDHCIDAVRYALEKVMKNRRSRVEPLKIW